MNIFLTLTISALYVVDLQVFDAKRLKILSILAFKHNNYINSNLESNFTLAKGLCLDGILKDKKILI